MFFRVYLSSLRFFITYFAGLQDRFRGGEGERKQTGDYLNLKKDTPYPTLDFNGLYGFGIEYDLFLFSTRCHSPLEFTRWVWLKSKNYSVVHNECRIHTHPVNTKFTKTMDRHRKILKRLSLLDAITRHNLLRFFKLKEILKKESQRMNSL